MLKVQNISFSYNTKKNVLNNVSFDLKKGEHLCIMGESGCGKSTLLKLIYGLFDLHQGNIFWNNQQILGPAHNLVPGMEFFKYVAQDFDLMPYTSVAENIGKFLSRFYPKEKEQRTQELLEIIEMNEYANIKVKNLSGGQQQRVAIARALAKEPELILLDEPFSQIDNFKKNTLRRNLFNYLKNNNITCIVATHDGNDALSFADQLIVIKNNKILCNGSPKDIYLNPKLHYVASLFDDVNELEIPIDNHIKKVLIYPNEIKIVKHSKLQVCVLQSYFKGSFWLIEGVLNNQKIYFNYPINLQEKQLVYISISTNILKNRSSFSIISSN